MQYRSSISVNIVDGLVKVISKPEFSEVSHIDFYNYSEDKLEILAEFNNSSSTEANVSERE